MDQKNENPPFTQDVITEKNRQFI